MSDIHGEIASMKRDLQILSPLEEKVDSMLKTLSLLERMEQMLQKLENLEKGALPENKKEKGPILEGPKSGLETARPEESSIGVGSTPQEEPKEVSMPEESLPPSKISETDIIMKLEGRRIEALTRCLEMPIFEGWNLEGWIFCVERFFQGHGMTKKEKLVATTISLDGEALAWFQCEDGRRPILYWGELKARLLDRF